MTGIDLTVMFWGWLIVVLIAWGLVKAIQFLWLAFVTGMAVLLTCLKNPDKHDTGLSGWFWKLSDKETYR